MSVYFLIDLDYFEKQNGCKEIMFIRVAWTCDKNVVYGKKTKNKKIAKRIAVSETR